VASLENFRLVVFRTVAEELSFRKAADGLYLTQPAVSLQIKALEEDLGVKLFDRSGTHVKLTAAGQVLLDYTEQAHTLLTRAEHEIGSLNGDHAGRLALGASTTIAQYVLPRLLGEFCRANPRVSPTLITGNTEEVVEALERQRIALGCIEGPSRSRHVKTEPFLKDELVLIAPTGHEWAERARIDAEDLRAAPLLMRERGSGTRRVVELALERQGVKRAALHVAMELNSTEAIKSAAEAGLGVGFVSRWAIAKDLRLNNTIQIVEVEGLRVERDLLVAYPAGPEPLGLAMEFRRFLIARAHPHGRRRDRPQGPARGDKKRK